MTKYEYKRCSLMETKGLKEAERLQAQGWTIAQSSPVSVLMMKKKSK